MSGVQEARQAVEAADKRCAEAASVAAAAHGVTEERTAWAVMMGLDAVAAMTQQAAAALIDAATQWGLARDACTAAVASLTAASSGGGGDVTTLLATAEDRLADARTAAVTATARVGDAVGHAAETEIADATTAASEAAAAGGTAVASINAATRVLAALRQRIDAARAGAGGRGSPAAGPQPSSAPRRVFKPMRTDPDKRDEIAPYVGLDYAVATLWDSDGNRVLGPHSADDDGPAAAADWRAPWGGYPRLRRHVEPHAAARLRPGDTMVMYINMAPCSYSDGCEDNLRDIIPAGATLVVHQVHASGWVEVTAYRGTGRAHRD